MMQKEIRFQQHGLIEERSGDKSTFTGIIRFWDGTPGTEFVLWDSPSRGKAIERIMPTAFRDSLASSNEIWALYNHDDGRRLGKRSKGAVQFVEEVGGLRYRIPLRNHPLHDLLRADIEIGSMEGSSFGFEVPKGGDDWRQENGVDIRELRRVKLLEVSPVFDPAYTASTIGLRSNGQAIDAEESWKAYQTKLRFDRLNK